jgi:hypothetical protein
MTWEQLVDTHFAGILSVVVILGFLTSIVLAIDSLATKDGGK